MPSRVIAGSIAVALLLAGTTLPATSRTTIFISDTHFGVGRDASGAFHPFEDARWGDEFAAFLGGADALGQGAADLILNGDTFELWQSIENIDCLVAGDADAGCSETEALARLSRVLSQHASELAALRRFAASGDNRVVIVPGNHDAALAFPRLTAEVLSRIGAPVARVTIAADGYWLSPDRRIYAEHGHQIGLDPNRFDKWPPAFRDVNGTLRLQRTWGEQFVQKFYNDYERKYPIIDNFSSDTAGIRYGIAAEGIGAVPAALGRFARFYLTELSLRQFMDGLGDRQRLPDWDIEQSKAHGAQFIVDSLPDDDPMKQAVQARAAAGTLDISVDMFTDQEISAICDYRFNLYAKDPGRSQVRPCPRSSLGGTLQAAVRRRDAILRQHLDLVQKTLRGSRSKANENQFALFVSSHTHSANSGFSPFTDPNAPWKPWVVNTGAWQRTVTPSQIDALKNSRRMTDAAVLTLTPEDLAACYPVVIIRPYAGNPESQLLWWRTRASKWSFESTCD